MAHRSAQLAGGLSGDDLYDRMDSPLHVTANQDALRGGCNCFATADIGKKVFKGAKTTRSPLHI
jgi:hypothetical protein